MLVADAEAKLACAMRELAMRLKVYPRWVAEGHMSQGKADNEIKTMRAIADDYRMLLEEREPRFEM